MSGLISLELQSKISSWRLRAAANELTIEEMREAVIYLRQGRLSAAQAAATTKKASASGAKRSVAPAQEDLLSELEGL
jgi:hypothetical protein